MAKFLPFNKRPILFKDFIEWQFQYCPFVWMIHGRQITGKIYRLHASSLRIVYNYTTTSFEELLVKDKTFTIHHQNIQSLAIETYKDVNDLPGGNVSEVLLRNNH